MIRKFAPQEDLDQATLLYVTSFPKEERRETTLWQKMVCKLPHMTTYTILYKESFAGFFTFWDFHNFVYGEHFAIDPLLRRKNIGGSSDWTKTALRPTPLHHLSPHCQHTNTAKPCLPH